MFKAKLHNFIYTTINRFLAGSSSSVSLVVGMSVGCSVGLFVGRKTL